MIGKELNTVHELKKKIRDVERRLQSLRTAAENLVPVLNGLPHSKGAKSRVEKIALDIVATEHELELLRGQMPLMKSELADKILHEVNAPDLQTLLILRYVECLSFNEIARRMKYGLRHIFRLHEKFFKDSICVHIAALSIS
ncbi:MAG: hypothetical protein IKN27_04580 [Selenomonadaceae bacterium]|nr:hypothetical protein [Selenomonadaceae bacterium]